MKSVFFKIIAVAILLGGLVLGWAFVTYNQLHSEPMNIDGNGLSYEVKSGDTLKNLVRNLYKQEVISNPNYLVWFARINGTASLIQRGEYLLKPGASAIDFLNQLVNGQTVQYSITIVEGWSFNEMMRFLKTNEQIKHTLNGMTNKQIMTKLGHAKQHPEGRFLPDTYNFPKGTTDLAFLTRAYNELEEVLNEEWESRQDGLPLKSPYEALILASIVEKETGLASERPEIAGVFIRRLQKRMRLQTDPTVIYGLGNKFDGNLRRRDLKNDTPYNTYRRHGLPPTPIALPGRDAIRAALNPDDGNNLYFVAKGDGSHKFTSNLKAHNNAVIKYQLKGRRKTFSSYKSKK